MNGKVNSDLKSLRIIIDRNKYYFFPVVIILISIILFSQFIIPQFKTLIKAREDAKNASLKLETLKENLNVLSNIDEASLDSQLEILNLALPSNKDFIGILNSIDISAQRSGVGIGAFSFQVGDLAKSENSDKFPTIILTVPISADIVAVNSFIEAIRKAVPLSEVSLVKFSGNTSSVSLSFYYKPLGAEKDNIRVNPLSQSGLLLLDKLKDFKKVSNFQQIPAVVTPSPEEAPIPL